MIEANVLLRCVLFVDIISSAKVFSFTMQKTDININIIEIELKQLNAAMKNFLKKIEKDGRPDGLMLVPSTLDLMLVLGTLDLMLVLGTLDLMLVLGTSDQIIIPGTPEIIQLNFSCPKILVLAVKGIKDQQVPLCAILWMFRRV